MNEKWKWGEWGSRILYVLIIFSFSISTLITIHIEDDDYTDKEKIAITCNFIGFTLLLIFQIRSKWIFGVILTVILLVLSCYRILNCYHII